MDSNNDGSGDGQSFSGHKFSVSPVSPLTQYGTDPNVAVPQPSAGMPVNDLATTAAAQPQPWHMPDPTPPVPAAPAPQAAAPAVPQPWHMPDPTPPQAPVQPPVPSPAASPMVSAAPVDPSAPALWPSATSDEPAPLRPIPVVRVLSPVGVEYVFMTVALFTGAIGLASALIALVNGKFDFAVLAFPTALLVVSVPLFATIFLHLKKLETEQPNLRLDPSKRRSTQFSQIASFVVCLFTLVGFVFAIFAKIGGQSDTSIFKTFLDTLCILAVAGGILVYYWYDEHKTRS